ncbi:ABC transporter ATP-binding protein [Wandonia haliotis]|uniref:ABC transporter ATP-binding protein n=1 Tax=Wandonia haliotis TaxID=574963 RepID=A0ABP3Y1K4_9FLAO
MLCIFVAVSKEKNSEFSVFKRLFQATRSYRWLFIGAFLVTITLAVLGPFRPMLMGEIVNEFLNNPGQKDQLLFWIAILLVILFAEALFQFLSSYMSNLLGQSIILDMRKKLFKHIVSFRMKFFDKTPIGSLVTRLVADIEAIADVFSQGLINILGDILALVAVVLFMLYDNWQLTLVALIPIPLLILATRIFARAMKKAFQQERLQVNRLNNFVQERITGMAILQIFNRQKIEMNHFQEINKEHRQAHINAVWANSIFFPIVELLSSISIGMLVVWSVIQLEWVDSDEHVFGEIIAFTLWIHMLYRPIRQLADKFNVLQRGVVRAERVYELLDRSEHIQDDGKVDQCDFSKEITFKNVWFAYKDEDWVLEDINLTIKSGETVAFVGATGAGKSTIVNLLGRFYEFKKGSIEIGGESIVDINLNYLRKNIAIVLQDVFLFSDTIHNNITLGDPSISREQVIEAAKAVGAHDFIMRLKDNYDYNVGERGGVLSVGQRQLLSFIRAFVYNPKILVLDEATSNVDNESEELIQRATEKLTKGRTSIVIAHRLSTIQKADKIVVMEHGRIIESGTHQELLEENGHYKKLVDLQFK